MNLPTEIGSKNTKKAISLIHASCCLMAEKEEQDPVAAVLKLTPQNLKQLINKIISALPSHQLDNAIPWIHQDILSFIAKNFVFFAAQEDIHCDHYEHHLLNFIACLSDQIDKRYYPKPI